MVSTKRAGLLAGCAALTLSGVAFADASADASKEDLLERLAAAEARLAELESAQGDNWLTEQRASDIRDLVSDVIADADSRVSLLQSGGTAGWNDGFFLASNDGNFRLNIDGQIQTRYVYNYLDENDDSDQDSNRSGFEVRRAKLIFSGHIVNPQWKYKVQGAFERNSGDFELEDAWIMYDYGNGWRTAMGQLKAPLLREELVSSARQLAVERSLVNEFFTGDRTQGLLMDYWNGDETFHFAGAVTDGARAANSSWETEDTEWAVTARAEIVFNGNRDQFRDFTNWRGGGEGFMLGGAVHYQSEEYGTSGPLGNDDETKRLILTVDGSFEFDGGNLFAYFVWSDEDDDTDSPSPWGVVLQGGIFLSDDIELFARYEHLDFDDDSDADELNVVTVGVNKYWAKHSMKWTTDLSYSFDEMRELDAMQGAGFRPSPEDDGQIVFRTQLQLLF